MTESMAYFELSRRSEQKRTGGGFILKGNSKNIRARRDMNTCGVLLEVAKKAVAPPPPPAPPAKKKPTLGAVLKKASDQAFRGGMAGFAAGVVQVGTFMWMRTAMNYQYAKGGNMLQAIKALYLEGGIPRFYKGVSYAIIQNPLSRFGDTAANTGVLAALEVLTPNMPVAAMTAIASVGGATWRIFLTPVDTFKTTLQVQGNEALKILKQKVAVGGIGVLYAGAFANFAANWVGNYPWFVTFNYLQSKVPKAEGKKKLLRNAVIGIISSFVSDCVSNSLRVIKTIKQTNADANISYIECVKGVLAKDGLKGLFGRGLTTRLVTNICQSMVFSVAWKAIEEELNKKPKKASPPAVVKKVSHLRELPPALGLPPLGLPTPILA